MRILIPVSTQSELLNKLHTGHLGMEKTQLRTKDCVDWIPSRPWEVDGICLFSVMQTGSLLQTTQSSKNAKTTLFSEMCISSRIVSYNGPHFAKYTFLLFIKYHSLMCTEYNLIIIGVSKGFHYVTPFTLSAL